MKANRQFASSPQLENDHVLKHNAVPLGIVFVNTVGVSALALRSNSDSIVVTAQTEKVCANLACAIAIAVSPKNSECDPIGHDIRSPFNVCTWF